MNIEKFTQKSIECIKRAESEALKRGNPSIEAPHVFLSLVKDKEGLIPELLLSMNVSRESVVKAAEEAVDTLPRVAGNAENALAYHPNIAWKVPPWIR
jgi:ATP-dependent Clp protease ATP-binding subunit ClpB